MRTRRLNTCLIAGLLLMLAAPAARGEVETRTWDYEHDGTQLQGYLAGDSSDDDYRGAVLIVHEWWGLNDYAKRRARQLAELGYLAFALDMYGKGKVTDDSSQASEWAGALYNDREKLRARAEAGLDAFREASGLGDMPVAAIGYCFGGTTVMELAWSGADLAGVVSFHGGPKPPMEGDKAQIQTSVLICHGAADPTVSDQQLDTVTGALSEADADWMLIEYAEARHAFTNPASAERESDAVNYVESADRRSWAHMKLFFEETFDHESHAAANTPSNVDHAKITIAGDGSLRVNNKSVMWDHLADRLRNLPRLEEVTVTAAADGGEMYTKITKVLNVIDTLKNRELEVTLRSRQSK